MPLVPLLAVLLLASPVQALTLDVVLIDAPNNPTDSLPNCVSADCGSVPESYHIGRTEITNAEYAEFLNAVAKTDPNALYHTSMGSDARGGITRSGGTNNRSYTVKAGHGDKPVVFVSFYDALRFANWLHNGQPTGAQGPATTEGGAYTISAGGIAANSIARNPAALFFVPTENEWYKAAYFDPDLVVYYNSPTSTDLSPASDPPPGGSNSANVWEGTYAVTGSADLDAGFDYLTNAGAYSTATSPFGSFDQAGNAWEWNETPSGVYRVVRGGGWNDNPGYASASIPAPDDPLAERDDLGFRVATVPEPGQPLLAVAGALVLAALRRRRG